MGNTARRILRPTDLALAGALVLLLLGGAAAAAQSTEPCWAPADLHPETGEAPHPVCALSPTLASLEAPPVRGVAEPDTRSQYRCTSPRAARLTPASSLAAAFHAPPCYTAGPASRRSWLVHLSEDSEADPH